MKKNVALYPFCAEFLPIVKHFDKLQDKYSLSRLFSPRGLGLTGMDAGYACNQDDVGLIVSDLNELHESSWEILFVTKTEYTEIDDEENKLIDIIDCTLEAGREVYYFVRNKEDISDTISNYTDVYPTKLRFFMEDKGIMKKKAVYERYGKVKTPVVLVGGLNAEADVLEVLSQLVLKMHEDGIRTVVLTKHPIGSVFGFNSLGFIFNNTRLLESEKITEANIYTRNVEATEMPDVILVEAPDAVMQFNDFDPNGFGIQTYMLCQALPIDYFICCIPCDLGVGAFIKAISDDFSNRFGVPISTIHVSNLFIDSVDLLQSYKLSYARANLSIVHAQLAKEKAHSEIPMYDVIRDGVDELYNSLAIRRGED